MADQVRLACGRHAALAALRAQRLVKLFVALGSNTDLIDKVVARGIAVEISDAAQLVKLAGTPKHQGVVALCQPIPVTGWRMVLKQSKQPLILVLDGVEDPRNLGACLRTAAAMGVDAMVHPRRRNTTLTPAARRVASGGEESVIVEPVVNLARELQAMQQANVTVIGTDSKQGMNVHDLQEDGPLALVLGGEAKGLRPLTRKNCDVLVSIPMPGAAAVASLNVAVACGICLFAINCARSGR